MRILYLLEGSAFAGIESYALNLIGSIKKNDDIQIFCGLFYDGPIKEKIIEEGISVRQLYGSNNLRSLLSIIKYIQRNKIDILHMVDLKSTIVGGFASICMRSISTVVTVHGLPEYSNEFIKKLKYRVSLSIYYLVLKLMVDRVICVSADLRSRLRKIVRVGKLKTIHNGIFLEGYADMLKKHNKKRELVIGTIGRLEKVKGYEFLLEAARNVIKKNDAVIFHIIGTGPLKEQLRRSAALKGISQRVIFLGFQADVKRLIEGMDIFVLSSLHEGIPYALLEAMSLRKPVVCTNVGGIKEVIRNNIEGLLVPAKDPLALSKAILEILDNKEFAQLMAANARKKVEAQFSSDIMGKNTHKLYGQLIQKVRNGANIHI